jgi:hypothetical protein
MADSPNVIRGWPGGMNNILPDYDLPANKEGIQNVLRNIVNADVLSSGRLKRRGGTTNKVAGRAHSLYVFGTTLYAVIDRELTKISSDYTQTAIRTLSNSRPVYYTPIGDQLFYSTGVEKGIIRNGVNTHWGVETPSTAPTVTAGVGALPVGRYMAAVTYVDALGQESGCSKAVDISLTAAGGITITIPQPTQAHVDKVRVYFTGTNDTVLYRIAELAVGVLTKAVLVPPMLGMQVETQFMRDFVPCELLEQYNGRIYGAGGNILWHTQALRYGLFRPSTDYIVFPAPIVLIAAVEDGLYVVADKTYWLGGAGPESFVIKPVSEYTAAKGSLSKMPNSQELVWYSSAGIVKAGNGGRIVMVQEPNVRGAASDSGATCYIEDRGIKKVIAAVNGAPFATGLSSQDYISAEIERAGRIIE